MKIRTVIPSVLFGLALLCASPQVRESAAQGDDIRETPIVKVVHQNAGAVVNISTEQIVLLRESPFWGAYGSEFDYLFDQFFGARTRTHTLKLKSVGSGVIVDESGIVVTNAHVVHMASSIFIVLNDGTSVKGELVYENTENDLALIKINPSKNLRKVALAPNDDVIIGETAIAIGNPLGLENTVTSGIISGKEREFFSSRGQKVANELLQTDAPINPGSSGGALLNLKGELVGINMAVVQNSQSIGFAIPVKKVREALEGYRLAQANGVKSARPAGIPAPVAFKKPSTLGMEQIFPGLWEDMELFHPKGTEWKETPQNYEMTVDVAGLDKDRINVEINEHAITISGEGSGREEQTSPRGKIHSQQFHSFLRTIPLPEDADSKSVKTDFKDDQLIIRLNKKRP